MGRFKFDQSGIRKIERMLKHQITAVQKKTAIKAYGYFSNFTYKATTGGKSGEPGGWTWNYVANWNVSVDNADTSVSTFPDRDSVADQIGYFADQIDPQKAVTVTQNLEFGKSVFVTNSVDYGRALNDGGVYQNHDFTPNRFLEGCLGHLAGNMKKIIQEVARETPSI